MNQKKYKGYYNNIMALIVGCSIVNSGGIEIIFFSEKRLYLPNNVKTKICQVYFGNRLKLLREKQQIPQRQLAALLKIDTATYCKIEKGGRRAKREQVFILSKFQQTDSKELLRLWSADKVYKIVAGEEEATQILNIVAESLADNY